jgi:hypothetical protein
MSLGSVGAAAADGFVGRAGAVEERPVGGVAGSLTPDGPGATVVFTTPVAPRGPVPSRSGWPVGFGAGFAAAGTIRGFRGASTTARSLGMVGRSTPSAFRALSFPSDAGDESAREVGLVDATGDPREPWFGALGVVAAEAVADLDAVVGAGGAGGAVESAGLVDGAAPVAVVAAREAFATVADSLKAGPSDTLVSAGC